MTNLQRLFNDFGQSPWIDDLSHELIESGKLQSYIDNGVRGLTSNPTILEKAILGSNAYDETIRNLAESGASTKDIYLRIVEADIKKATELFRPLWESSGGEDGFVSLEVSPDLADDFDATVAEAKRLWSEVNSLNLMIKIPATDAGIQAIGPLIAEGINLNITLLFSLDQYQRVVEAYSQAINSEHPSQPRSVASFFVSRIDSEVDKRLEALGGEALQLRGQAAVASAHLAYEIFRNSFQDQPLDKTQRVLWASTSVKNPIYDDLMYVRYLAAPHTVNTMPQETLDKVNDHLSVETIAISDDFITHAHQYMDQLKAAGVDMTSVADTLKAEGVKKFQDSFASLLAAIDSKR